MKTLSSLIRHVVTGLAGIGTYLGTLVAVDPGQVDQVNQLGAQLVEPLAALLSVIAMIFVRLAITWLSKRFPSLAGLGKGVSETMPLLAMGLGMTMAGLMGFSLLSSCSPSQVATFREIPLKIGIHSPEGSVSYSSKSGIEVVKVKMVGPALVEPAPAAVSEPDKVPVFVDDNMISAVRATAAGDDIILNRHAPRLTADEARLAREHAECAYAHRLFAIDLLTGK